jgi:hypothetical protein
MWGELEPLHLAIEGRSLPPNFDELFGTLWNKDAECFNTQETYILDYKDKFPENFTNSYGIGIVRLALAMLPSLQAKRLKDLHFTIPEKTGDLVRPQLGHDRGALK